MSAVVVSPPFDISGSGLRNVHGRGMNTSSDVYKLPADEGEMTRLSTQHHVWSLCQGGLYPPDADEIVQRLLVPRDDGQPAVLDVGSGSGAWAIEMASKFPQVKFLGIDLAQSKPAHVPSNCSFEVRDVMKGLDDLAGQFELVHCRMVGGHVPDVEALVRIIASVLKPGGLFLFLDGVIGMYNAVREALVPSPLSSLSPTSPAAPTHSHFLSWFTELTARMACAGQKHVGGDFVGWHLQHCGAFSRASVVERVYWTPLGWEGEERTGVNGLEREWDGRGAEVGELTRRNIVAYLDAGTPLLLSDGVAREVAERWTAAARAEVLDPERRMYLKWGLAYGVKLADGARDDAKGVEWE